MRVGGWLVAESDGDYSLTVSGALTAKCIVALGHHMRVAGSTVPSGISARPWAQPFRPELVNEYGAIRIDDLAAHVMEGKAVRAN